MNTKKWLFSILGAMLVTALVIVLQSKSIVQASSSQIAIQATATASTTLSFMSAGTTIATTTYQFDSQKYSDNKVINMQAVDSGQMQIEFLASTTPGTLAYQFQASNNNTDWYGESSNLTTANTGIASTSQNTLQVATTTVTHLWSPNSTATSTISVPITILPAPHERVIFFLPSGAGGGGVYAEFDFKSNPTTP